MKFFNLIFPGGTIKRSELFYTLLFLAMQLVKTNLVIHIIKIKMTQKGGLSITGQ